MGIFNNQFDGNVLLQEIEHNIKDHVEVVNAILNGNEASGEARENILNHIMEEELLNQKKLEDLSTQKQGKLHQNEINILLDHSTILINIIKGQDITPNLSKNILHHFLEEHEQDSSAKVSNNKKSGNEEKGKGKRLTVGSLIGLK